MSFLLYFVNTFAELLILLILIRVIMSWFRMSEESFLGKFIVALTDPIYAMAHAVFPRPVIAMIDFTPIIAYIIIEVVRYVLVMGIHFFM